MLTFQKISLNDWERLRELERVAASKFFAPCQDEEGYKRYIRESEVFFVVRDDKTIGTISYKNQQDGAVLINGLTIVPEYRQQGIARQAMEQLLERIGDKECFLLVHPANTPALLIYLRLGFVIREWKENYFGNGEPRLFLSRKMNDLDRDNDGYGCE